ncbi:MAG: oligosaccharide flippase family protein [bacterium]
MRWQILRGVAWQGSATVLARAARSLAWLVLGGLLSPREFGAFAAIYVVVDGLYLVQDLGLAQSLVVRRSHVEESADSTFILTAVLGISFAAIGWLLAPAVACFYGNSALVGPFRVLSCVLVLNALRTVPLRLLERGLDFRGKLGPTAWGAAAFVVVAIGGASAGWGVWSLVIAVIASSAAETAGFWIVSPWRPGGSFSREVIREDVLFGAPVVAAVVLAYAHNSLDRFVLGRFGSVETLGAYAFALSIAMLPTTVGSTVVNTVLLPSYGGLGDDPARRRELHLHALALTGGANLLFAALVLCLGGPFLHSVYGSKWDAAVGPLQILAICGVARSLSSLTGQFLVGAGCPASYRAMNLVQLMTAALGIGPAIAWGGASGVALAMTISAVVATIQGWRSARTPLEAPLKTFPAALAPSALAFAVTWGATSAALRALRQPPGRAGVAVSAALAGTLFLAVWWRGDTRLRRIFTRSGSRTEGPV